MSDSALIQELAETRAKLSAAVKALEAFRRCHGHHNDCPNVGHPVEECRQCHGGTLHRQALAALAPRAEGNGE